MQDVFNYRMDPVCGGCYALVEDWDGKNRMTHCGRQDGSCIHGNLNEPDDLPPGWSGEEEG